MNLAAVNTVEDYAQSTREDNALELSILRCENALMRWMLPFSIVSKPETPIEKRVLSSFNGHAIQLAECRAACPDLSKTSVHNVIQRLVNKKLVTKVRHGLYERARQ